MNNSKGTHLKYFKHSHDYSYGYLLYSKIQNINKVMKNLNSLEKELK